MLMLSLSLFLPLSLFYTSTSIQDANSSNSETVSQKYIPTSQQTCRYLVTCSKDLTCMYHPLSLAAVSFHFTQNLNIEYRRLLACEERERERETPASSDSATHRPIGPSLTYTVALCLEV